MYQATKKRARPTATQEVTKSQVMSSYGAQLSSPLTVSYATYRTILKHPTVALGAAVSVAPIKASKWAIAKGEGCSEEAAQLIEEQILPLQSLILEHALRGSIVYGFAPFEKVYEVCEGQVRLTKLKPLLQDLTKIRIQPGSGAFDGFSQEQAIVPVESSFNIPFQLEGTQWYGMPLLENVRGCYNSWVEVEAGASRYDRKVAGSHWVIYYPQGKETIDGAEIDNYTTASAILGALESSGSVAVPRVVSRVMDDIDPDKTGWKIELINDGSGKQYSFLARSNYFDKLMIRGLLTPERTVLEGQFGTKAEAGVHADLALTAQENKHKDILRYVNWYLVNDLLRFNFGPEAENTVSIVAPSLIDASRTYLETVYTQLLTNADSHLNESAEIDSDSLRQQLGIPSQPDDIEEEEQTIGSQLEAEEDAAMSLSIRTERGEWMCSGASIARSYGAEFAVVDEAFAAVRELADCGDFDKARRKLFAIKRTGNGAVDRAIDHRVGTLALHFLGRAKKPLA